MELTQLRRGTYLTLGALVASGLSWSGAAAAPDRAAAAEPAGVRVAAAEPTDGASGAGPGALRVTTSPAVPSDISVDGIETDTWALTWARFPAGFHEVCFGAVSGYRTPDCQDVLVEEDVTTTVVGTFSPNGYLRVITDPPVPSTILVDGVPRNDWGLWAEYAPGTYEVCFDSVAGRDVPPCRDVAVVAGATATTTGTFSTNPTAPGPVGSYGYLRATTDPAVDAMISVDGIERNNWGLDWMKLPPGSYDVCFGPALNASTPACETTTVAEGETAEVTGSYPAKGFLRVTTAPQVPATISVDGSVANAFGVWTPKVPGLYDVCFGTVDGYVAPPCELAEVQAGETVLVEGAYVVGITDSDDDRLADSVETDTGQYLSPGSTGTDPFVADTDGDGIDDGDEVLGSGGVDYLAMGARPVKKDVLLEFDWFDDANECGAHSHRPTPAVIERATEAFAAAPVANPDGTTGVNLISDYGQGGPFTGGNLVADADGVIAGNVFGADYLGIRASNFAPGRAGKFHYVLMPHRYATNSTSSGYAEILGNDMIVSLYCAGSTSNVANTIVHELGHNLGLRHGGDENTNNKPNYNSVMNYRYQFAGIDTNCTVPGDGVLDFSTGARATIFELMLIEGDGICDGVDVDWNENGVIDVGAITRDINADGDTFGLFHDHDDWANIVLSAVNYGADPTRPTTREFVAEQPVPDWAWPR